jgi:class 3 adenylate cyclase
MRAIDYRPSPLNRRLCKCCIRAIARELGGAELEISVLFADVRGSTAIAERMHTSIAGPGEILVSAAAAQAGVLDTASLEQRTLDLQGKEEQVDAWVL